MWKAHQDHHPSISRGGPSYWFNAVEKRITLNPWRDGFVFRNIKNTFVFSIISQQLNGSVNYNLNEKHNPVYSAQSLDWLPMARPRMGPGHQDSLPHKVEPVRLENVFILQWRHYKHDGVSNHQPHDYLLKRWFRCRSKKTSKLRVTGLCEGNSPVIGEFPAQMASNAENVSIWCHHHELSKVLRNS